MLPRLVTPRLAAAASFLLLATALPSRAGDWPQWRGPNGDGTSDERGLPAEWSPSRNIAWRLDLPGPAGSTPAVWGERIFLTSPAGEDDLYVLCVSRDGKELWRHKAGGGNRDFRKDEGNCAAPSPATDGKHVWAFFGTGQLVCLDVEGKLVWEKNLVELYGPYDHWHGYSSTPLIHGGALYQMCLRMKDPYLLALDKLTGQEKWKRARESDAEHESRHSYASPVLYRDGDRAFLLAHGGDFLSAHNLDDGNEIWRCGSLNPREKYNRMLRFVASPVARPGLIVVPSAKGNPVLAVRPDGKGDVTASHVAWKRPRDTTDVPTPAIHDGLVYMLRENGVLIVIDAASGEEVYLQRLHDRRQRSSPVVADGKLFCAARDGVVHVVKLGRKFEVLAQNDMDEDIAATPAVAGGRIYLRTFKHLYAIEKREEKTAAAGGGL
jgi:outer membrane protein assembly factor BamB